jgi:hypothetical protein
VRIHPYSLIIIRSLVSIDLAPPTRTVFTPQRSVPLRGGVL